MAKIVPKLPFNLNFTLWFSLIIHPRNKIKLGKRIYTSISIRHVVRS